MALRDVVGEAVGYSNPSKETTVDWRSRTQELLYEGETVEETVDVGETGHVVVTSHRVLAFTPTMDGANFHQVERPNVDGVDTGVRSNEDHAMRALQWGLAGILLMGAGLFIDFGSMIGDVNVSGSAAGRIGVGGIMGFFQTILDFMRMLDEIMLVGGALLLIVALAFAALFIQGRQHTVVLRIAGEEDLHLPRDPTDAGPEVEQLERALGFRADVEPE